MVVAVTTLPELIEEADLACLCTIEAFHMMPDRTQTADSPFRVSVGLLRIEVLQAFRMEGKGVLKKVPAYLDVVAATRLGLREFRKGEHYLFCLSWDPLLKQFVLPEGLAMLCPRTAPDVSDDPTQPLPKGPQTEHRPSASTS